jgi:hypothetical protein
MPTIKKHKWNPPQWMRKPIPTSVMFHDVEVEAYLGNVSVEEIRLWRGNDRTLLDIAHIKSELRKSADSLSDAEIINYILRQGLHKIPDLAKSIKENGVRIPLVLTSERELLDGNRRFLACQYLLKRERTKLKTFTIVPVYCLKPRINDALRLKIIAEMNFLPDYKEQWPREVRAKFVIDHYYRFRKLLGEEKALQIISYELEVNKSDVYRFKNVLEMIEEYVRLRGEDLHRKKAEIFARDKFHFFEEFYNKAIHGRDVKTELSTIREDTEIFFNYLTHDELNSTTRIRDLAFMVKVPEVKRILKASTNNFEDAKAVFDDLKLSNKVSSRIERFCYWLDALPKIKRDEISSQLRERLIKAATRIGR